VEFAVLVHVQAPSTFEADKGPCTQVEVKGATVRALTFEGKPTVGLGGVGDDTVKMSGGRVGRRYSVVGWDRDCGRTRGGIVSVTAYR